MTDNKKYNQADFQESNFGIRNKEDLVHIFNVLRNKMYTNKVLAVLREYSTNAMDAHIESGQKDRPIEVTLPVTTAPVLKIRDYGQGLSEDDIRNVYTMYGASTKRGSSELNGQLGFGSKAAFSYVESYTIVSYHNGKETIYEAYVDETGLGAITQLSSVPSDKPSGIELRINVQLSDIPNFKETAVKLYKYFQVTPVVNNLGNTKIVKPEYKLRGTTWGLREVSNNGYGGSGDNTAIMGNVGYPLSRQVLADNLKNYPDWKRIEQLLNCPIDFFTPVGQLSIAASREALEYDKKTLRSLSELFNTAIKEITEEFQKRLAEAKDLVEAKSIFKLLMHGELRNLSGIILASKEGLVWNGKRLTSFTFETPSITRTITNDAGQEVEELAYSIRTLDRLGKTNEVKGYWTGSGREIEISDQQKLFVQDTDDKPILRARKYLQDNEKVNLIRLFKPTPDATIEDISGEMGIPLKYFIKLSSVEALKIETATKTDSPHKAKHQRKVFRMVTTHDTSNGWADSTYWEPISIDSEQEYFYVYLDRFCPQFNTTGRGLSNTSFREAIETAERLTGTQIRNRIIGIKLSAAEKVSPTWRSVRTVLEEHLNAQLPRVVDRLGTAALRNLRSSHQFLAYLDQCQFNAHANVLPATSPIRVFMARLTSATNEPNASMNLLDEIRRTANHLGIQIASLDSAITTAQNIANNEVNAVLNRYPMLRYIGGGYGFRADHNFRAAFMEYCRLMDTTLPNP